MLISSLSLSVSLIRIRPKISTDGIGCPKILPDPNASNHVSSPKASTKADVPRGKRCKTGATITQSTFA